VSTSIRLGFAWPAGAGATPQVWVDDVRLQPAQAQVTAYVYDRTTLKLLASFDDQHFGLFYQYDSEGRLVRKLVETERGRKTVQETQYNVPKVPRPLP
jgi:YD repeat-containing protein